MTTPELHFSQSSDPVGERVPSGSASSLSDEQIEVSVVVPVYKEEGNIEPFLERLIPVLEKIGSYEVIFALDPCPDDTEAVIRKHAALNPHICLLIFSRRFGQPAASMSGILNCRGKWCVIIDVDLQDPPEVIDPLYRKAQEGFDVVTARRSTREGETVIKKLISSFGYSVINRIADVQIPRDTGDFRIVSRRVIEELRVLRESHGFLRGLVSFVGFKQGEVLYQREQRVSGMGNYNRNFGSMKISFNGLFGFSTFPLQIMIWTGFAIASLSGLAIFLVIALKIILGNAYPTGTPTILILILFMGGVQLTAIGVLGEYIGRIYEEVRDRPMFIVDRALNIHVRSPRGPSSQNHSSPVREDFLSDKS